MSVEPIARGPKGRRMAAQKASFLVWSAVIIVAAHVVDLVQAGGPNWPALALRVGWAAVLLANALNLSRGGWLSIRVGSAVAAVGTAAFFLGLLLVTGRSRSPLYSFTFVLVMMVPLFMGELIRVALVISGFLLLAAGGLLALDGATAGEQLGWAHIGVLAFALGFLLAATELRGRRAAEALSREREEALTRLAESERLAAVGRLAAQVAHDVSNPLAAARSTATFIRENATGTDEEVGAACGDLVESLDRIAGSVRQLRQEQREVTGSRPLPGRPQ